MFKKVVSNLLSRKTTQQLLDRARTGSLKKTLNAFDLFVIGIGAVVGTGILTIIGTAIQGGPESIGAGPAIIVSMVLAALACVFSALCYSEVASIIPVSGSVYTYCYATLGEFAAWIVGWVLMLNYVIGNITVASSWCGYLTQLLKGFSAHLPSFITNCPIWLRSDVRTIYHMCDKYGIDIHEKIPFLFDKIPFAINLPVIALTLISTLILIKGIKESTRFATIMVGLNLFMIISFIIVGAFYVKPENWVPFAPNGISGILMGAFIIFFAYIGFDAVSTAAEETKNPQKDLPIAILGTLIFCTILYILVALVLTGIVPINQINPTAPIAAALSMINKNFLAGFISVAAVCALASVFLICQLASTRILYAMSRDKFLPKILRVIHRKHRTPHIMTWTVGLVIIICSLFMDLNISAELCNYGTFTSFIAICIAVIILRKTEPNLERPFKVPFVPLFPILGIIACLGLMIYSLQQLTTSTVMFPLWILIGTIIYFGFSYKNLRK
ncbi:MAG: amino acid permease [Candidatus Gastranaerophilales bacterium]|nr:amino acid permease [Candidatus Gastranaerophilales bacterium]